MTIKEQQQNTTSVGSIQQAFATPVIGMKQETTVDTSSKAMQRNDLVYVINYDRKQIEEAMFMGFSDSGERAWVKIDAGNYNEVIDLEHAGIYGTAEQAQRAMFKLKLAGEFRK